MDEKAKRPTELPPDLVLDEVAKFVFDHHHELLTEGERGLALVHQRRAKAFAHGEPVEGLLAWRREHPELAKLVDEVGVGEAMRRAAARVMEEHRVVLPRCGRCGALLRTPRARLCVGCGLDWHG